MTEGQSCIVANEDFFAEVKKLLAEGRQVVIRPKGMSMLPFIVGDVDRVTLAPAKESSVGDIVLAEISRGKYVLHRIYGFYDRNGKKAVHCDEDTVVELMGDGNLRYREKCVRDHILAKAVNIISPSGKVRDCNSPFYVFAALCWRTVFFPFRRVIVGVLRRIIQNKYK